VVPALATLLLRRRRAGVSAGIGTSMLMGMYAPPRDHSALIVFALGILTAIILPYLLTHVRRRIRFFRAMMLSSLLLTVGIYIFMSVSPECVTAEGFFVGHLPVIGRQLVACGVNGVAYTVLILLLLPLCEKLFGVCSDISLNGFADLGNPLLEQLATEAPGTYAHSLTVATLATAAADRIEASALLVRVGSFYHDIGKLSAPPMFIENTTPERNPHNTLNPSTSATWVRSHVKDGIVLAHKAALPPAVIDILREHHGTTPMTYFLHRAKELAKADEAKQPQRTQRTIVDESQFRYEGPCPSTKEAAIVMLADCAEAASRSLPHVTPRHLEHLVSGIIEAKIKDGQLDDTPLSMMELTEIKKSFVASLATILHVRMRYPKEN
jgi:putative nucleotidyltransferase with HDIG domain